MYTATCSVQTQIVGTMRYMAPEMFKPNKGASKATYSVTVDTWATGCSVVEMLTGSPPWKDYEQHQFIMAIIKPTLPDFSLPANISKTVQDFLAQCFCRDPQKRMKSKEIVNHSFCIGN